MTEIRWAIAGTGPLARYVAGDLALTGNASLSAVGSRSRDRAQAFAEELRIERAYGSYAELLAAPDVDAIYLATPSGAHHAMALEALAAGKHVLIEKPMATSAAEVREIIQAASRAGLFAMEAMWMKFSPMFGQLLVDVETGAIGSLRSIRASLGFPGNSISSPGAKSALLERGIYPITLAHRLLGTPESIVATGTLGEGGVDSAVQVTLHYSDGRFAQLSASQTEYVDPSAAISGTGGWIRIPAPFWSAAEYATHSGAVHEALRSPTTTRLPIEGNGYVPMLRAASAAISSGWSGHPVHPMAEVAEVFRTLDEIRAQLRSGL